MLAKDLVSDIVPALKTSDTGAKALSWMEIFRISHLPIVNNSEFLGMISDNDIYDLNMVEEAVGNHSLSLRRPYVYASQHVYEVIEVVSRLKLSAISVLDENNNFIGVITLQDIIEHFSKMTAVQNPGGIIVLQMNSIDYSLSEITQIIEGNDARILSLYVSNVPDTSLIDVTIKTNKIDLSAILQTFYRFDYNVRYSFSQENEMESLYQNRFEEFMTYLNV